MPDVTLNTRPVVPAGLPFAGLGFDLAPVAARASLLTCRRRGFAAAVEARPLPPTRVRAGYGLMLWLSRETGGS